MARMAKAFFQVYMGVYVHNFPDFGLLYVLASW